MAAKWNKPRLHSKRMAFHPLSICCLLLAKRGARLHGFNSNVSLLLSSASQATSRLPPRSLFIVWCKRHGMEILSNTPSCRPHRVKAPSLPQQSLLSVKEGNVLSKHQWINLNSYSRENIIICSPSGFSIEHCTPLESEAPQLFE